MLMLMHRLRECMWEKESGRFEGETEIDELLLMLQDGRLVSILTAYNRPTRRVRFKIVERMGKKKPKATKREMLQFIRETTVQDSTILTDGDASIPKPAVMRRGHESVIHKRFQFLKYVNQDGKDIEVTTNRAEGKTWVLTPDPEYPQRHKQAPSRPLSAGGGVADQPSAQQIGKSGL